MPASEQTALSERQTSRLVLYLDQHMLQIQRGFQKRHEPNAQLASLPAFLDAWQPMLEVVSATPLRGSAAALRDAYLLRLTTEITEGIVGYTIRDAPDRVALLTQVLYWTDLLDQLWDARIRRIALPLVDAKHAAHDRFPEHASEAARVEDAESVRPSAQVTGDTDASIPAYDQTERVRLRDVLSQAEQQLFAWMRDALGAPPPPVQDEEDDEVGGMPMPSTLLPNKAGQEGSEDDDAADNDEDAADMDNAAPSDGPAVEAVADDIAADAEALRSAAPHAEAVRNPDATDAEADEPRGPPPEAASPSPEVLTEEQQHYADVFEHKLDPDADDSDAEESDNAEGESDDADAENPPRKRARREPSVSVEALGWWDMHYTRAFSRAMQDLRINA